MLHSDSPSFRKLAVPGIGFAQSAPAGDVFDLAAFRRAAATAASRQIRDLRRDASEAPGLLDLAAAGFIIMSVAFGPVLMWLLTGAAAG
jgi:hypothetical protein